MENTENEGMQIEVIQSEAALSLITKAEIDVQISTAKAYPRSIKTFLQKAESMATVSESVAESCNYALPRGGKSLQGPSVRLAEIICATYGNIRSGARVIANDGKTITAQGICHDLETNNSVTVEVKKSIMQNEYVNGKKTGRMVTMSQDMQTVTGNAACAIAFRNAVFKVVPVALINEIYEKTKEVAKGTAETLPQRRDKAIKYFKDLGVTEKQICEVLELRKIEDIDLDTLSTLRGMVAAIKNGESTVKDLFEPQHKEEDAKKAAADKVKDLKKDIKQESLNLQ